MVDKKLVMRIILFLSILVTIVLLINYVYMKTIIEKKTVFKKREMFKQYFSEHNRIKYMFFGSCHTSAGVNPEYINNSYNYAFDGESPTKIYYKVREVIDMGIEVDTMIFELHQGSLSSWAENSGWLLNELYVFSEFVSYKELKEVRKKSIIGLWIEANIPVIGNGAEFKYLLKKPKFREIKLGWLNLNGNLELIDNETINMAIDSAMIEHREEDLINKVEFEHFLKSVNLAHDNGINVIIIHTPVSKPYGEALRESGIDFYGSYEELYDEIDFEFVEIDYFDRYFNYSGGFADIDHLNEKGAERLSRDIAKDLEDLKIK